MRTISIMNQKGGCGKTTTAVNLSACLAKLAADRESEGNVLLIDMDPQSHASISLNAHIEELEKTLYDVLTYPDQAENTLDRIVKPILPHFDLVPSSLSLFRVEDTLARAPNRDRRLADCIRQVSTSYEYVIVDCPPSMGLLTSNALMASDEVIITIETSFLSLQGVNRLLGLIQNVQERKGHIIEIRALATMYDRRTNVAKNVLLDIRDYFEDALYDTVIHRNVKLTEAASFGMPITEYASTALGYRDYMSLAEEVIAER